MQFSGGHPTDEQIDEYCEGEAAQHIIAAIEAHLLDCALCSRKVNRIVRAQFKPPSYGPQNSGGTRYN